MTIQESIEKFMRDFVAGHSKNTIEAYGFSLKRALKAMEESK